MMLQMTPDVSQPLLRSVLYMPGANARALEKARSLDCDAVIFDLEDAVAPAQKALARDQVVAAVEAEGYGHRQLVVRINALDTPWGAEDLAAVATLSLAALLFPKVDSAADVQRIDQALRSTGAESVRRWFMVETPRAVLELEAIVDAAPELDALVLGTSDLVQTLRARHQPDRYNLGYALQRTIMVARSRGLTVLDGVQLDFRNSQDFARACEDARAMGFDGKTLIHPLQIDEANRAFGPDPAGIEWAERVCEAFSAATAAGQGVVELDGQLIESLHVAEAERTLAFAAQLKARSDSP